jgi:hypothetical protein
MVVTAVVTAVDDDDGLVERHRTTARDARCARASRRVSALGSPETTRVRAHERCDASRRRRARACAAARVVIDVPRGRHRIARLGDENLP